MLRRFIYMVPLVLVVVALAGFWLNRPQAPLSMVPIGPVVTTNRGGAFLVAITNNSRARIECHVCREAVGRSSMKRVELSPESGVVVRLPLKSASPWTLNVWYQRQPDTLESQLRGIGARLRLCERVPTREKMTSVEVSKDGSIKARQPTPVERQACIRTSLGRRACALSC